MAGTLSEVKNGVFVKKATTSSTIEEVDAIHSMIYGQKEMFAKSYK